MLNEKIPTSVPRVPRPDWIKVGTRVRYHPTIGGPPASRVYEVRTEPRSFHGQWVVWLKGKPGCVSTRALSLAPEMPDGR